MTITDILSKYKPDAVSSTGLLAYSWPLVEKMLNETIAINQKADNEKLERAAEDYYENGDHYHSINESFRAGAKWMEQHLINSNENK